MLKSSLTLAFVPNNYEEWTTNGLVNGIDFIMSSDDNNNNITNEIHTEHQIEEVIWQDIEEVIINQGSTAQTNTDEAKQFILHIKEDLIKSEPNSQVQSPSSVPPTESLSNQSDGEILDIESVGLTDTNFIDSSPKSSTNPMSPTIIDMSQAFDSFNIENSCQSNPMISPQQPPQLESFNHFSPDINNMSVKSEGIQYFSNTALFSDETLMNPPYIGTSSGSVTITQPVEMPTTRTGSSQRGGHHQVPYMRSQTDPVLPGFDRMFPSHSINRSNRSQTISNFDNQLMSCGPELIHTFDNFIARTRCISEPVLPMHRFPIEHQFHRTPSTNRGRPPSRQQSSRRQPTTRERWETLQNELQTQEVKYRELSSTQDYLSSAIEHYKRLLIRLGLSPTQINAFIHEKFQSFPTYNQREGHN